MSRDIMSQDLMSYSSNTQSVPVSSDQCDFNHMYKVRKQNRNYQSFRTKFSNLFSVWILGIKKVIQMF